LIEEIDSGDIGLPDIQRPFIWKPTQVRNLFDSMYRGFPVGYLLFWENEDSPGARQIGVGAKRSTPKRLIVDGQQRLTSIYTVIKGLPVIDENWKPSRIRIAFHPLEERFEVSNAATDRDAEWLGNISEIWAPEPGSKRKVERAYLERLRQVRDVSAEEAEKVETAFDRLYALNTFPFNSHELSAHIPEEQAADVFVRINSAGVTLNQADFILTLMSVFWDEGRRELEAFSRASKAPSPGGPSPFNHFIEPAPDQLLRVDVGLGFRRGALNAVYSLLRGRDLDAGESKAERRDAQFAKLKEAQTYALDLTNWHEFMKVLLRAGYRGKSMLSSQNNLLYAYVIFLIGKRDYHVDPATLREVIARWFFMAALTGRYTNSPEYAIESDLARLRDVADADAFTQTLDAVVDQTLTADYWAITLPNLLATSAARSPSLMAYHAALNLLDAKVLFSHLRVSELLDPAISPKWSAIERHHLFPKAYLKRLGTTATRDTNQIGNMALLEWPDNADISDAAPAEYFPPIMARVAPGDREQMLHHHALPDGWEAMDYPTFLIERRKLMAAVVRQGFQRLRAGHNGTVPRATAVQLMMSPESETLEFKSTARWNLHTNARDERLEKKIAVTTAAFMNASGGTLLIGVDDNGLALGLDHDLSLMARPDTDRYQTWLYDLLDSHLGKVAAANVRVSFEDGGGTDVCRVDVRPATGPVFVKPPRTTTSEFYVRLGNSSRQLGMEEFDDYRQERWGSQ
jgi:hypothetical protein